jgi:hypothetical protein
MMIFHVVESGRDKNKNIVTETICGGSPGILWGKA